MLDILSSEIVTHWFLQSLAMGLTAFLIPKLRVTSIFGALIAVFALALINATLWNPDLFFFIPNEWSYHVGSLLLANGLIFWLVVKLAPGIEVDGILPALIAPVVFTVLSVLINEYGTQVNWAELFSRLFERTQEVRDTFLNASSTTIPKE